MPWVVVGVKPMPTVMTLLPVVTFWIRRYFREALVTAEVAKAVLAVVGVPKRVVREPLGMAPTVTVDAGSEETVTVPEIAGREPMVTVPETGRVPPNRKEFPPTDSRPTWT